MTDKQQSALRQWAEAYRTHVAILEFLAFAELEGHIRFGEVSLPAKGGRRAASLSDVLDVYYNIDRKALDDARRALLEEQREANNAGKTARSDGSEATAVRP